MPYLQGPDRLCQIHNCKFVAIGSQFVSSSHIRHTKPCRWFSNAKMCLCLVSEHPVLEIPLPLWGGEKLKTWIWLQHGYSETVSLLVQHVEKEDRGLLPPPTSFASQPHNCCLRRQTGSPHWAGPACVVVCQRTQCSYDTVRTKQEVTTMTHSVSFICPQTAV